MLIERSQFAIGLVVGALLLAGTAFAVTLQAGALSGGTDVVLEFADANGVESGAPVQVAGVRQGQVTGVEIVGDHVEITVRTPAELSADTRARITTTNALGARAVALEPGRAWDTLLNDEDEPRIPLERTELLVDLPGVTDETVELLEESDTDAAAQLFASLADVTEDQRDDLERLLDGMQTVGTVVEDNREDLETFLDDTNELLEVLNGADRDLLRTIDGVGATVAALNERREELVDFVRSTASFSATTADLVSEERERIDRILDEVAQLLALVDEHQIDLAHTLAYGGVAFEGFASVAESGGVDNPYWGNILTASAGQIGTEAVAGCGGVIDEVFDTVLGPGPECPPEERSRVGDDLDHRDVGGERGEGPPGGFDPDNLEDTGRQAPGSLERFLGGSLLGGAS
jgi:phospholipid/cholesterol/gamma-HCH transport system substrate-binding protein